MIAFRVVALDIALADSPAGRHGSWRAGIDDLRHQFVVEQAETVPRLDIGEAQPNDRRLVILGAQRRSRLPFSFCSSV